MRHRCLRKGVNEPFRHETVIVGPVRGSGICNTDILSVASEYCWKCFEASGVEPVFRTQRDAISYATGRACFRSGEIRIFNSRGAVERIIPFSEAERKL